jgi:hypothetical protein
MRIIINPAPVPARSVMTNEERAAVRAALPKFILAAQESGSWVIAGNQLAGEEPLNCLFFAEKLCFLNNKACPHVCFAPSWVADRRATTAGHKEMATASPGQETIALRFSRIRASWLEPPALWCRDILLSGRQAQAFQHGMNILRGGGVL